jgi:predicted Zn-dependent protease
VPGLSAEQEAQIGAQADVQLRREARTPDDEALQREAQQAGARLAAAFGDPSRTWRIAVLDFSAPNAFALPGGYVYLTRGLFPYLSTHDELAAVLAHEMAHVVVGDAAADYLAGSEPLPADLGIFRTVARLFGGRLSPAVPRALFASHDAERERAANALAAKALAAAGFDPASMNVVLETLDRLELDTDERGVPTWGMTHNRGIRLDPSSLPALSASAPRASASPRPADDDFVDHLRGLLFGDDPRLGLVRVNEFVAPELRMAVRIPDEWDVSSDGTRMIAASPGQDAFIVLQLVRVPRLRLAAETAAALAGRAGFRQATDEAITINGLPASAVTTTGTVEGLGQVRARIALLQAPGGRLAVAGVAESARYAEVERQMAAAITSVREMTASEAGAILPARIDLETAEPNDTWDTIARRHGGVVMGHLLAILNHSGADRPVPAGARIKVVVATAHLDTLSMRTLYSRALHRFFNTTQPISNGPAR